MIGSKEWQCFKDFSQTPRFIQLQKAEDHGSANISLLLLIFNHQDLSYTARGLVLSDGAEKAEAVYRS